MRTYTNIIFDNVERGILRRAALHLRIAFPDMDKEMPKRADDRLADHEARVIGMLHRDATTGTFDNLARAQAVLAKLVRVIEPQTQLGYWLAKHREERGTDVPESDDPTSAYQQYSMLASIRSGQLKDVRAGLELVTAAGQLASPSHEVSEAALHSDA
jgi:hypothetical protein